LRDEECSLLISSALPTEPAAAAALALTALATLAATKPGTAGVL
jgi:hypothetical protein